MNSMTVVVEMGLTHTWKFCGKRRILRLVWMRSLLWGVDDGIGN